MSENAKRQLPKEIQLPVPPRPPENEWDLEAMRGYFETFSHYLRFTNPPVKKFPVMSEDPLHTLSFLDLDEVCLVTSKVEGGRPGETMWVSQDGSRHYSAMGLADIERKLCFPRETTDGSMDGSEAGNPWFLRTHLSYLVNLRKVRAFDYSSGALTLWFEGLEEAYENTVSSTYRPRFDAYFVGLE